MLGTETGLGLKLHDQEDTRLGGDETIIADLVG